MGFGDFQTICEKAPLPLCALVGHQDINNGVGIQTECYARTVEIANTLIFETANDFMHILAMVMTVVMIIHVRSKFTAVGTLAHRRITPGASTHAQQAERRSRRSFTSTSFSPSYRSSSMPVSPPLVLPLTPTSLPPRMASSLRYVPAC